MKGLERQLLREISYSTEFDDTKITSTETVACIELPEALADELTAYPLTDFNDILLQASTLMETLNTQTDEEIRESLQRDPRRCFLCYHKSANGGSNDISSNLYSRGNF